MKHYTSIAQMSVLLLLMECLGGFIYVFVGHKISNNGSQLAHEPTVGQLCSMKHYKAMPLNSGHN
jgi:hypothetical protein